MKNIKHFNSFPINEKYKLPIASGDPEKDQEIFWFSIENKEKSLMMDLFLETISQSVESGKKLKGKEINAQEFTCEYKPGDKFVYYSYYFWTPDEEVVKKSQGHYKGHEWRMRCEVPYDIIEKLNSGELTKEEAKKRIEQESRWFLDDGMDPKGLITGEGGSWQLAYNLHKKETDKWVDDQMKKHEWKPKWLKDFSAWFTDKFA